MKYPDTDLTEQEFCNNHNIEVTLNLIKQAEIKISNLNMATYLVFVINGLEENLTGLPIEILEKLVDKYFDIKDY